jgi:hypothetical protein
MRHAVTSFDPSTFGMKNYAQISLYSAFVSTKNSFSQSRNDHRAASMALALRSILSTEIA